MASIELRLQANPSIYAVSGPSSGISYGIMGKRNDVQYRGFDVLGPIFGMTMSDEHDRGSILCLRENHRADSEDKDDNVLVNKWLDDNL